MKKRMILFLCLLVGGHLAASRAKPFEQAEVTKAVNIVSLLPQTKRAVPGDVVAGDTGLKTGGDSRAELQFPDLTITRVGSNALFRFVAGTREMILDSGTMLFSSPEGAGGGTVQAGAVTAAVTGSDFMISNVGRVKVICLSHKVTVYLTANPKIRAELRPGQMLDIAAGVDRKMPRATTINLGQLLATSKLAEAGGFRPLPSQTALAQNINRQRKVFSVADTTLINESAEVERSTTELANSTTDSANNSAVQSRQAVAAQTARESTSAASTVGGSVGEQAKNTNKTKQNGETPGNSGNKEDRGNSDKKENPGNSDKKENPGNSDKNENPGNSDKKENPGNSDRKENPGNSARKENPGNSARKENPSNSARKENPGNSGNNGNRGNSGK